MHSPNDSPIHLPDEAATVSFAARLAHVLIPGLVVYLHGDLGTGKTTLVRGMLQSLGYQGRVKSPTYTLLEQYQVNGVNLRHFDLYRFRDATEWESAGFNDEFDGSNICIIEWPEMASGLLPQADIELFLEISGSGRNLRLQANSTNAIKCLKSLDNQVSPSSSA